MIVLTVLLGVLGVVVVAVFVFATTAGETIAWWTRLGRNHASQTRPSSYLPRLPQAHRRSVHHLSQRRPGRNSGEEVPDRRRSFLNLVERGVPGSVIVRDVFPFSPSSTPLTEHRLISGLWTGIPKLTRRDSALDDPLPYHLLPESAAGVHVTGFGIRALLTRTDSPRR